MSLFSFRGVTSVTALVLCGFAAEIVTAKNGRDFGGFYTLTNVEHKGAQVQATLVLRLYNYSGSDLKEAAVVVRETPPSDRTLASFSRIPMWLDGTDVIIHRQVTIPREEFQLWSGRSQPNVFIINKDDSGREFQRTAQLSPHPIALPVADEVIP